MRCPAYDCSGGHSNRVSHVTNPESVKLPDEIWQNRGTKEIWHCGYCGFLWFNWFEEHGLMFIKRGIGFYDNFTKPNEFFETPGYRLREDPRPKPKRRR